MRDIYSRGVTGETTLLLAGLTRTRHAESDQKAPGENIASKVAHMTYKLLRKESEMFASPSSRVYTVQPCRGRGTRNTRRYIV